MADNYEFTADWFSHAETTWLAIFQQLIPGAKKILEIGSYEGRSAIWLIKNGFSSSGNGELYCIDNWEGGIEHDKAAMVEVMPRFDRNIEKAAKEKPSVVVHKLKSDSRLALKKLFLDGHGNSFDFIYVDASHQAADVLTDLVLCFGLCRIGGIIACDDYLWNPAQNPLLRPKIAIDAFVNCFAAKVVPVTGVPLYQLFMKKVAA